MIRTHIILLAVCIGTAVMTGCDKHSQAGIDDAPEPEPTSQTPTRTLIFLDRSTSSTGTAYTRELFVDSLQQIVMNSLDSYGDELTVFPVHERTASKIRRIDIRNTFKPPRKEHYDFLDDWRRAMTRHRREVANFLQSTPDSLRKYYANDNVNPNFTDWTDLWSTLGIAGEEFDTDSTQKKIYYFSDMFESMQGTDRRDFSRAAPESRKQAEQWAKQDAEKLSQYMILKSHALEDVHIRVLQGELAAKENAQTVKFYWLQLFQASGIGRGNIDYN